MRCYLRFIRLIFFIIIIIFFNYNFILFYGTLYFAFCICRPLETHRGDKSKCSSSKNRHVSAVHVLRTRETRSALTSRWPPALAIRSRLRKWSTQACLCASGPQNNNTNIPGTLSSVSWKKDCRNVTAGLSSPRTCVFGGGGRKGWMLCPRTGSGGAPGECQ